MRHNILKGNLMCTSIRTSSLIPDLHSKCCNDVLKIPISLVESHPHGPLYHASLPRGAALTRQGRRPPSLHGGGCILLRLLSRPPTTTFIPRSWGRQPSFSLRKGANRPPKRCKDQNSVVWIFDNKQFMKFYEFVFTREKTSGKRGHTTADLVARCTAYLAVAAIRYT